MRMPAGVFPMTFIPRSPSTLQNFSNDGNALLLGVAGSR